jgi:lysophospholipase-3
VASVPTIDPWTAPNASTYVALLNALVQAGATPGASLFAAGYDWRLAPDALAAGGWYQDFTALISKASEMNGGRKVWLIGHSAGPSYLDYFLKHADQVVVADLVAGVASLNGNLKGEIDCLENLWAGGTFGKNWNQPAYRKTQSTWGITSWCMPQQQAYANRVLVVTHNSSNISNGSHSAAGAANITNARATLTLAPPSLPTAYTAADLPALIHLAGLAATMIPVYESVANLTAGPTYVLPASLRGVCLYGEGISTPIKYTFPGGLADHHDSPPSPTFTLQGDGQQDDTTNTACKHWGHFRGFPGADHDTLLSNPDALATLIAALQPDDRSWS